MSVIYQVVIKKCWRSSAKYEMDWLEKEVLILTRTAIDYYKDIDPDYKKVKDEKKSLWQLGQT